MTDASGEPPDLVADAAFSLPTIVARSESFVGRSLYGACSNFHGTVNELLLYARAVRDEELIEIEAALQERWGCCTD